MARRRCPACEQSTDARFSSCEFCGHAFPDAAALPPAPVGEPAVLDPAARASREGDEEAFRAAADAMLAVANPLRAIGAVAAARRASRSGNESAARRARIAAAIAIAVALVVGGVGTLRWYADLSFPSRMDAQMAGTRREVESALGPLPRDSDLVSPDEITRIESDLDHDRISDRGVSGREVKVFAALRDAAGAHRITQDQLQVVESLIRSARADHMVDPDEATHILDACDAILAAPAPKTPAP